MVGAVIFMTNCLSCACAPPSDSAAATPKMPAERIARRPRARLPNGMAFSLEGRRLLRPIVIGGHGAARRSGECTIAFQTLIDRGGCCNAVPRGWPGSQTHRNSIYCLAEARPKPAQAAINSEIRAL